jgi:hypothetical protein
MWRGEQEDGSVFCQKSISCSSIFTISTKYFQRPLNCHTPVLEGKIFYNPVYSKSKMFEDDFISPKVIQTCSFTNSYEELYFYFLSLSACWSKPILLQYFALWHRVAWQVGTNLTEQYIPLKRRVLLPSVPLDLVMPFRALWTHSKQLTITVRTAAFFCQRENGATITEWTVGVQLPWFVFCGV